MAAAGCRKELPWKREYYAIGKRSASLSPGASSGKNGSHPHQTIFSQNDMSLAYTPGVAVPCLEIQKNPEDSFNYTNRSNLIGVISNGTAVLGLGNIGALAGKPVMEGKAVLSKRFADSDVFDLEGGAVITGKFV